MSTDPTSPYYADQTQLFSNKQWVPERFCESAIQADPQLTTVTVSGSGAPSGTVQAASIGSGEPAAVGLPNTSGPVPAAAALAAGIALLGLAATTRRRRRTGRT